MLVTTIFLAYINGVTREENLLKLRKFYAKNQNLLTPNIEDVVEEGFDNADERLDWIENFIPGIIEILDLGSTDGSSNNTKTSALLILLCIFGILMKM